MVSSGLRSDLPNEKPLTMLRLSGMTGLLNDVSCGVVRHVPRIYFEKSLLLT